MKPTKILIDWYSFTLFYSDRSVKSMDVMDKVNYALFERIPDEWGEIVESGLIWKPSHGRSPYTRSFTTLKGGLTVFVNEALNHFLVEISGKGCEALHKMDVLDGIISQTTDRTTRIDIAVDIQTETTPEQFVKSGYNKKFSAVSSVKSKDGETEYIGSRKSERYCRVYKYNAPHIRSDWLRCEFVFKKKTAKMFAENMAKGMFQMNSVANGCKEIYKFEHEDFDVRGTAIEIKSYTPDRGDNKTIYWILTAVVPAFKRLVKNGVIENPEEWLRREFIDE